uniref:Uncharacterized protein n=1 Tax=Auxenochlorella protothecoides TaxID=3075 RepID=A0A1D2A2Z9_AUXPR
MAQPGRFPAKLSPMFAPGPKVEEVSAAGRAHHTLPGRTLAALAEPSGCNTSPMPAPTPDYEGEHPLCNAVSASATLMSTQRSPLRPRNRAGDETPTSPLLPGAAAAPVRTSMDFEAAEALAWLANGKQTAAQAGPDGAVGIEQRQPDPASTPAWEGAGPGGALGRVDGQGMPGVPHRRLSYEDDARKRMGSMAEPSMGEDGGDARCPKTYSLSSRVGQAALSILEYVTIHEVSYRSAGMRGVPERVLRQEFGNNPDTSKALRCLVTEGELQREGRGGRKDPFSYTLTAHPRPASSDAGAGRGDDTGPAPRALRSGGQDSGADAGVVSRAPRGPELGPPAPAPAPRSQRTAARQAAAQGAGHATARQAAAPCAPPQRQRSTPVQDEEDALWSALARVKRRRRTALAPASTCDSSASEAAAPPPAAAPPAAHPPAQAQAWAAHASGHMHAPGHAQRPGHSQAQGHPQAPPHAQAPPRAAARPASPGRPPLSTLPGGLHEHAVLNAYFSAAVVRQRAQQAAAAEAHHAAWMHPSALPPSFLHAGGVAMPTVPHHGAQRPPADGQAAHKALPRVNPYLAAQLYWQMTGGGGGGRP